MVACALSSLRARPAPVDIVPKPNGFCVSTVYCSNRMGNGRQMAFLLAVCSMHIKREKCVSFARLLYLKLQSFNGLFMFSITRDFFLFEIPQTIFPTSYNENPCLLAHFSKI